MGIIEDAYPSIKQPRTVTLNGVVYNVASTAFDSFSKFALGSKATLILDDDNNVVAVSTPITLNGWGILKSADQKIAKILQGDGTELVLNGRFTGTLQLETTFGNLVDYSYSGDNAKISIMNIKDNIGATCDFDKMLIGNTKISPNVVIYETDGYTSILKQIDFDELDSVYTKDTVRGCHINEEGYADIILLKGVANTKKYGYATQIILDDSYNGFNSYKFTCLDDNGESLDSIIHKRPYEYGNLEGLSGVKTDILGRLRGISTPKKVATVSRDSFFFDEYVKIGNTDYEIVENCPVYNSLTEKCYTVDKAKTLFERFTVYIESDANPVVVAILAE